MNVKVGIIDADLLEKNRHRMPNLACMKISSYHKQMGDQVELLTDYSNVQEFGRVYLSKVFTGTRCPEEVLTMEHVKYGGTGFYLDQAPGLPYEVEHTMPDYSLYANWLASQGEDGKRSKKFKYYREYSVGFLTRAAFGNALFV